MSAWASNQRVCEAALPRKTQGKVRFDAGFLFCQVACSIDGPVSLISCVVACIVLPISCELCAVGHDSPLCSCLFIRRFSFLTLLFVLRCGYTDTRMLHCRKPDPADCCTLSNPLNDM